MNASLGSYTLQRVSMFARHSMCPQSRVRPKILEGDVGQEPLFVYVSIGSTFVQGISCPEVHLAGIQDAMWGQP